MLSGRTERFRAGALVEVFNEQGEAKQLKLFRRKWSHRRTIRRYRERTRQFGSCGLGLELWKQLELDRFFEDAVDEHEADVPWSRVAALRAINRLCVPGSELAIEERWYPWNSVAQGETGTASEATLRRAVRG